MRYKATREIACGKCGKVWAQPKYYLNVKCPYCKATQGHRYTGNSCKE